MLREGTAQAEVAEATERRQGEAVKSSRTIFFWLAAVVAFSWFMWLSGALQIRPGSPLLEGNDYLLSADIAQRLDRLSNPDQRSAGSSLSHPLLYPIWGQMGEALHGIFGTFVADPLARILAVRTLVALHAALGFAFLLSVAGREAPHRLTIPLASVYLLFTSQVLISLPEHMGLSAGLLSATFATFLSDTSAKVRAALLVVFGFMLAGATITNGAFGGLVLSLLFWTEAREMITRRRRVLALIAVGGVLAGFVVGVQIIAPRMQSISSGDTIAQRFWNGRALSNPGEAIAYMGLGLVFPAVGPDVAVSSFHGHPSLTYEPMLDTVRNYGPVQALSAVAWSLLLLLSARVAIKDARTRMPALLLIFWWAVNSLFHNFWGDEYVLYSTHWAFGLFALTLLAAKSLPTWIVLPACVLIAAGQIVTLVTIIKQVERIVGL